VKGLAPLIQLLVVLALPKKLTDKFVLESDRLRAADRVSGVYIFCLFSRSPHLIADYELTGLCRSRRYDCPIASSGGLLSSPQVPW